MLPPVCERVSPLCPPSRNDDRKIWIKDIVERYRLSQMRRSESVPTSLIVFRLAKSEGNVAVFDHMLDLSPHYRQSSVRLAHTSEGVVLTRQTEEDDEIHHQYWPKHRHVEYTPPSTKEGNRNRPCTAVPEFEFWQPSYEWAELFILLCR